MKYVILLILQNRLHMAAPPVIVIYIQLLKCVKQEPKHQNVFFILTNVIMIYVTKELIKQKLKIVLQTIVSKMLLQRNVEIHIHLKMLIAT